MSTLTQGPPTMKRFYKITLAISIPIILIIAFIILRFTALSFQPVIPGQVYRDKQPSPANLTYLVHKYHIKSVVNLRGLNKQYPWYRAEVATAKRLKIHYYNNKFSSWKKPSRQQLLKLIKTIQTAPRPILFHCLSGVDRSGLASSITLILKNQPLAKALIHSSWHYGVIRPSSLVFKVFPPYQQWLLKHNYKSQANRFIYWVTHDYNTRGIP